MKKLLILLPIILIAGCTGMTGYSVINAFDKLPEVKEFKVNYSNTDSFFNFLTPTEVNESLNELDSLCGGNITSGTVYFARISEDDAEVNAWFDTDYETLCVIKNEGVAEEINESGLVLESELIEDGTCVKLSWTPYPLSNLKYYKIVKSNTNNDPQYPDQLTIETITSRLNNSMIYCPDKEGVSYFGVTMVSMTNETDHELNHSAESYNYTNPVEVVIESQDFDLSAETVSQGTCLNLTWINAPEDAINYAIYRSTNAADLRNKVEGMMLSVLFSSQINNIMDCNLNESDIFYRIVATMPDNTTKMSNTFAFNGSPIVGTGGSLLWGTEKACLNLEWDEWPDPIQYYAVLKSFTVPLPTIDPNPSVSVINNIATSTKDNTQQYDCVEIVASPIYYRVAIVLPDDSVEYTNVAGPGVNSPEI
jgi:hypothetical protein